MKKCLIIMTTFILFLTGCTGGSVYYEFGTPTTSSSKRYKTVIKSSGSNTFAKLEDEQLSVCIYRNNALECFENNNYEEEITHLKSVFGADSCESFGSLIDCSDDYLDCYVEPDGKVGCYDIINDLICILYPNDTVKCE